MKNTLLLAKFGKREHLEMLKAGTMFFNPIHKFRKDDSSYRGDKNEGGIPINPKAIRITNEEGKDLFSDLGLPYPDTVMQTAQGDDTLFMFCATNIDKNIFVLKEPNEYVFSDAFKGAINQFGEMVLLLSKAELIDKLSKVREQTLPAFGYISDSIIYRDINNFSNDSEFKKAYYGNQSFYDRYFVKGLEYKDQNEWRIIIDGSEDTLKPNCGEGYSLQLDKLDYAYLFETSKFLDGFSFREDED